MKKIILCSIMLIAIGAHASQEKFLYSLRNNQDELASLSLKIALDKEFSESTCNLMKLTCTHNVSKTLNLADKAQQDLADKSWNSLEAIGKSFDAADGNVSRFLKDTDWPNIKEATVRIAVHQTENQLRASIVAVVEAKNYILNKNKFTHALAEHLYACTDIQPGRIQIIEID
jgi:hypothetical protein